MTVNKLPNGKYEVSFYYEHPLESVSVRFRKWTPFTSKRRAERWEAEQLAKVTDRNYWLELRDKQAADSIPIVRDYAERFLREIAAHREPGTCANYRSKLFRHVVPALGDQRLDQVTDGDVAALLRALVGEKKPNTIRGIATALAALYSWAEETDVISPGSRPRIRVPLGNVPEQRPSYLTDDQVLRLIESAPDRVVSLIKIGVRTGLRIGELQGLIWDDVDRERGLLRVRRQYTIHCGQRPEDMPPPKYGRPREIPLTATTLSILDSHRASDWSGDVFVFSFAALGVKGAKGSSLEPVHSNRLRSVKDTAFARAGIPESHRGWHTLRHTFAAKLATKGISLRLLQNLLGHSTMRTTEIYAHLLPEANDIARRLLDNSPT